MFSCRPATSKKIKKGASVGSLKDDRYLRWPKKSLPLTIEVSHDLADIFDSDDDDFFGNNPIEQMLDKWNLSLTDKNFFNLPTNEVPNIDHNNVTSYNDSSIGIYRSDTWFPSINSSALAITQYYARRRNLGTSQEYLELTHADIIINYRYYEFTKDETETGLYHLPSVILHELGHLLGLSHQINYDLPAVMSPYMSIVENHDDIKDNDIKRIKYKYDDSNISNLDAGSGLILGANSNGAKKQEFVRGVIELRSTGEHKHYILK